MLPTTMEEQDRLNPFVRAIDPQRAAQVTEAVRRRDNGIKVASPTDLLAAVRAVKTQFDAHGEEETPEAGE